MTDRALPLDPTDPAFVRFSDEYSEPHPWFELISAAEWKDLTFFARPDHVPGEQCHEALARALDELRSPVELRSKSRSRLVWTGVEFSRDDVMLVWPRAGRAALPAETTLRAELRTDPTRGAPAEPEAGTDIEPPPAARDDADDRTKRRLEYKPKLETFMRGGKPRGLRLELTDESIARQFVDYCKDLQRAGKQAPRLPQDIRNIERQVAKIRERIAAAGARKTDPNTG